MNGNVYGLVGLLWIATFAVVISSGSPLMFGSRTVQNAAADSNITHIWIIPHTHDDVGWLQTVDQYYVNEVQWILDTGVQCMADSPFYGTDRRYSYVEMAYLYRWWNERPEEIRQRLRTVIQNGLWELNLAGWCMNDEAVTFYSDVIDQMTEGALFVKDQIGEFAYPKVGWHIDPFGHSSAVASMWADIGFEAFGLNRIDFVAKDKRRNSQELEFVWRSSKSRGKESDIFVHLLTESYSTPPELNVDNDSPDPQNDPTLPTSPVTMVGIGEAVVAQANMRKKMFRHNHVLVPFGNDFAHQNGFHSFQQMDKIINYINSNASLNATIRYGTFSEYIQTLNQLNITWPTYEGDFFPYISGNMQSWTGFYTSRPHIKGLVRSSSAVLRVAELLYYSAEKLHPGMLRPAASEQLGLLRRAMATVQHHDAVTGTERDKVAQDYAVQLEQGLNATKLLIANALSILRSNGTQVKDDIIDSTEDSREAGSVVTLYNSVAWPVDVVTSLPINSTYFQVVSKSGEPFAEQQIVPRTNYSIDYSTSLYILYFRPGPLPPLGYTMVRLQPTDTQVVPVTLPRTVADDTTLNVSNNFYHLSFYLSQHELATLTNTQSGETTVMNHEFKQYMGSYLETIKSGAYIFNPQLANRAFFVPESSAKTAFVDWKFPEGIKNQGLSPEAWPLILVSAHASVLAFLEPASFAIASVNTNYSMSTLVLRRVDGLGWREIMGGDYLVLDEEGPLKLLSGTWKIGTLEIQGHPQENCTTAHVEFPVPFVSPPIVLASTECRGSSNASPLDVAAFSVTLKSVSTNSATFNVCSVAGPRWTEKVYLNWLLLDQGIKLERTQLMGTTDNIDAPSMGALAQVNVPFPEGYTVFEPSIILTVKAESGRAFVVSSALVTPEGFIANVYPLDGVAGDWTKDMVSVSWYAFERPAIQYPIVKAGPAMEVVEGSLVTEVRQFYKTNYAATTRLYHGTSDDLALVEVEYDLGQTDEGREVVSRYSTSLHTDSCFTDDNGLEMLNRTFNSKLEEQIAGNYYPMVQAAEMRDEQSDVRLAVLSDRSHGLGCLGNGMFEIMLQRQTLEDDNCGLNESLNDLAPVRPRFWILQGKANVVTPLRQKLSLLLQYPVHIVYHSPSVELRDFSLLKEGFPGGVHLLSLKVRNTTQKPATFVFRVQNLWQMEDKTTFPQEISLTLKQTFADAVCPVIKDETNLTANRLKSSIKRLYWRTNQTDTEKTFGDEDEEMSTRLRRAAAMEGVVNLETRQIRTFLVT